MKNNNNGEGSATMSKGRPRDDPATLTEEQIANLTKLAAATIMQRNFSHGLGLNIGLFNSKHGDRERINS